MKPILQKTVACCVVTLGFNTTVLADASDVIDSVGDSASGVIDSVLDTPFDAAIDGVNEGLRTATGTTTIKGNAEIEVKAKNITQEIAGGDNNLNELNLGSVGGRA